MSDQFVCSKCGDVIRDADNDWKIQGLFYALNRQGICERCEREGYNEL